MLGNTGNCSTQKRLPKEKWHQAVEAIDECIAGAPYVKVHTHTGENLWNIMWIEV